MPYEQSLTREHQPPHISLSGWEWATSLSGSCKRYSCTCGRSIDMGCSAFRHFRCSTEPQHPSWSAPPAWSRALVLHKHMRCRCCKVKDWLRASPAPHLRLRYVWQMCSHMYTTTYIHITLTAAGEGWSRASQSRRLLWVTGPSMEVPSPAPQCSSMKYQNHPCHRSSFLLETKTWHTHRNHPESMQEKTWALFWDGMKENVKTHWRHERKKLNRSRSRDVSLRKWQGTQEKIREIV